MVLDFTVDREPAFLRSFIVDNFGFEWSYFNGDFDDEQAWYFIESEQEH